MEIILVMFSTILANNIVLSQVQGICPFTGVSKKTNTALGMGVAVTFVLAISSIVTNAVYTYILVPLEIDFMSTLAFILIIAGLVQMIEIIIKKFSPTLYRALGVYLPLITTNCAVLGTANTIMFAGYNILEGFLVGIASGIGFTLAIFLMSGIRERMNDKDIPKAFRGFPIALVTASIMALAFGGFYGVFAG